MIGVVVGGALGYLAGRVAGVVLPKIQECFSSQQEKEKKIAEINAKIEDFLDGKVSKYELGKFSHQEEGLIKKRIIELKYEISKILGSGENEISKENYEKAVKKYNNILRLIEVLGKKDEDVANLDIWTGVAGSLPIGAAGGAAVGGIVTVASGGLAAPSIPFFAAGGMIMSAVASGITGTGLYMINGGRTEGTKTWEKS